MDVTDLKKMKNEDRQALFISLIDQCRVGFEHPDPLLNAEAALLFTKMISDYYKDFDIQI